MKSSVYVMMALMCLVCCSGCRNSYVLVVENLDDACAWWDVEFTVEMDENDYIYVPCCLSMRGEVDWLCQYNEYNTAESYSEVWGDWYPWMVYAEKSLYVLEVRDPALNPSDLYGVPIDDSLKFRIGVPPRSHKYVDQCWMVVDVDRSSRLEADKSCRTEVSSVSCIKVCRVDGGKGIVNMRILMSPDSAFTMHVDSPRVKGVTAKFVPYNLRRLTPRYPGIDKNRRTEQ